MQCICPYKESDNECSHKFGCAHNLDLAERDSLRKELSICKGALERIANAVQTSHNSDLGGKTCISVGNRTIATKALKEIS